MSKIITSPVKRFPGTVTLSDPLTYPQLFAYEDAIDAANDMIKQAEAQGSEIGQPRLYAAMMAGVLKCVEDHDLKGVPKPLTVDNFPASPGKASNRLASWLINEVAAIYGAEDEDPNE